MLIELRREVDEAKLAPWRERVVFKLLARLLRSARLYRLGAVLGRWLQRPFVRGGRIPSVPLMLGEWTRTRDLPAVAARTFTERWPELERETRR
jgi:L-lactate dehydrogenase complex protein LldF